MCLHLQRKLTMKEALFKLFILLADWLVLMKLKVVQKYHETWWLGTRSISKEVVLITGGGGRLGRQIALCFARKGCTVVLWDIDISKCEATAEMIGNTGGKAFAFACDVSDRKWVYQTAQRVRKEVGKVDILVNNASIGSRERSSILDTSDAKIMEKFEVNALGTFWTAKAFINDMMNDNYGYIVSIASAAGLVGLPHLADYCASKYAAVGFVESLRKELEESPCDGVRVLLICQGQTSNMEINLGFKKFKIGFLSDKIVAESVVNAVLKDKTVVVLPTLLSWIITLRNFVPEWLWLWTYKRIPCSGMY